MQQGSFRLVVLGDSTSFTDDKGPQMPSEPSLYPNVVARALEEALDRPVQVQVVARAGSDAREAYRTVLKDRLVMFEVLMGCDAVVVGVGSIDHAPAGVPAVLEDLARQISNTAVRRASKRVLRWAQPRIVALTRARYSRTPTAEFRRVYDGLLLQVRALSQGVPAVALGPTSHTSSYYGSVHPQHGARAALQESIAASHGIPMVQPWGFVEPVRDRLNPDGIHWPAEVHAAVGAALAEELIAQVRGERPAPGIPW